MSGLYLMVVVLLWSWLTWLVLRFGWRLANRTTELHRARMALAAVVVTAWLVASFWYSGGQNFYYDWKVRQMCAVDGGVKVYETVTLPAELFDKWGRPKLHIPITINNNVNPAGEYYMIWRVEYLRKGNPNLSRDNFTLIRRTDNKVLGESVSYGRGGGGLPGPWYGSSYTCPDPENRKGLETSIFIKGKIK